jgi:hypothetical protein
MTHDRPTLLELSLPYVQFISSLPDLLHLIAVIHLWKKVIFRQACGSATLAGLLLLLGLSWKLLV